ncbi:MAG TPA: xanthine dehydrogenase family protein subunit M [Candidatus Polarisedimenticolaceae bacterium]|nr:xanthine dehydrogenase family protein subunit M [Candidatus Polarisedimenticolaceae bacterium]
MIRFDYLEPATLSETFSLLEQHGDSARVIAGGTSLIIWMRQRLLMPKAVIGLGRIPDLDTISFDPQQGLRIGAGARHRDIELSQAVKQHYPLLHETFRKVAQPRIRNMGTIGGNLAGGDPLTDPGASLIALDAELTLAGSKGTRTLSLENFFVDYYQTALEPGELLTEIRVPPPQRPGWSHIKFTPRSVEDFATVGVAMTLRAKAGSCEDVRLALNSVASTIVRAKRAEDVLRGKRLSDDLLREAGEMAATEVDPMDDNRGSADYKRDLVKVLVRRAAEQAIQSLS